MTVFCILVSCAVQIVALRIYTRPTDQDLTVVAPEDEHFFGSPRPPPHNLASTSLTHLKILSAIRTRCPRFESPLLADMQKLLEKYYHQVVLGYDNASTVSAATLMLYRWSDGGTGILPLTRHEALAIWTFPQTPEENFRSYDSGDPSQIAEVINAVCSPGNRICQPGYFDMSVLIG